MQEYCISGLCSAHKNAVLDLSVGFVGRCDGGPVVVGLCWVMVGCVGLDLGMVGLGEAGVKYFE